MMGLWKKGTNWLSMLGKRIKHVRENGSMFGATRRVVGSIPRRLRSVRQVHGDGDGEEALRFYKSRGQHILINPRILDTIVLRSAINPTDTVLEIGPGTGNLTLKLLEAAHKVVAIEIDHRMVQVLEKRVLQRGLKDKLRVIERDAMRAPFPRFDLVVANIPYRISSPLVIKLVYGATPFRSATLLLQKEFARRLLACPGDSGGFNRLSANVKLVADVELVMDVSKRDFLPSPKVDSSVVIIRPKHQIPNVDLREWRAFTRTCFSSNRNKTLGALFKLKGKVFELFKISNGNDECSPHKGDEVQDGGLTSFKEKIIGVVRTGGFEEKRPAKLSLQELLHLLSLFNQAGIYFNHRGGHKIEDILDDDDE